MPNMPKNVIVVLLDSLNRHMLGSYGGTEFDTPNIDRFARRAVQFDNHFVGTAEIDMRGTPVRAYAYIQRPKRS